MLAPLFLFADSQPLFAKESDGQWLLSRVHGLRAEPVRRAVYLGASNGDRPEFFDLFSSAASAIGVVEVTHVTEAASPPEKTALADADLVLLAGGDVAQGLAAFHRTGLDNGIVDAYLRGAILVGVSAGAVQLGSAPASAGEGTYRGGFRFVPCIIDVHDDPEWASLRAALRGGAQPPRGIGIPRGGAALFHREGTLEPLRGSLLELSIDGAGGLTEALLLPSPAESDDDGPARRT